ncbi:ABC transporter permease [Bradyrhizobium sp. G127]|uniref:ABC transporter permease n=1 Tax=Bradyrhizobium sp. G127 TaxID=2904800 RepID=UPI001F29E07D|nr:ABC transporter permease [Bradyrhizobium sp. G127]MCF2522852.1 ABC transporter permease [Bradyrhizobium sp. G127]
MTRPVWILRALLSHWTRHRMQLATLLVGLISATALWSGVQALNQQARNSYDRAAASFGGGNTAMLVGRDGPSFPQQLFVDLRRANWAVSPVVEGRVAIGGRLFRLLGIEPLSLPPGAGTAPNVGQADLQKFLMPPGQTLVAPETLADLKLSEGATPQINTMTLPPIAVRDNLAPGVLIVDIGVAQRLLSMPDQVSRLLVGAQTGKRAPLEQVVGDKLRVVEAGAPSDLERLTSSFHLNLTAFGLLSFVVGLFIVHSAIGLALEQRLPMLRTMRACGVSARALTVVLVTELVSIALLSGIVGLICGYVVAAFLLPDVAASLRGLYGAQIPGQLSLHPSWWLSGLGMSVLGALLAAAAGLYRVYRLPVLAAAQPYAWQQSQQRWLMRQGAVALAVAIAAAASLYFGDSLTSGFLVLAGLLLAAALALPVLLGAVLWFGQRGTVRPLAKWFWADSRQQLPGLSLALMALLLALAVNVGVGTMVQSFSRTFTAWLDDRLAAEIYLNATSDVQGVEIVTWLRQRPEVEAILPAWRTDVTINTLPVEVLGFADHATYRERWPLLELVPGVWDKVRAGEGALVSEQLARRLHVQLEDEVKIPTSGGLWPIKVAGIYPDYGNPKGQIGVDIDALAKHWPEITRTRFGLRVKPDKVSALVVALRDKFGLDSSRLLDQATLKSESTRIFNRTFSVTSALNAFTLGVAGVALLTSLLTLSNSRLPQLAPLWALGLTRRRLAGIELLKTMSVAFITALLALPLGLLVAWCLVAVVNVKAFGWRLPFHVFPTQLFELLAIAMLAALLATCLPILRLMRLQPAALVKIFANER